MLPRKTTPVLRNFRFSNCTFTVLLSIVLLSIVLLPIVLLSALALTAGTVQAAPSASVPAAVPAAPAPDYGGRDSAPLAAAGDAAPDPAAQAGRALEALVVVLAGVAGVVYVLKRFDLVKPGANGKPGRIAVSSFGRPPGSGSADIAVVSSQTLPGGAMLHVVRAGGKNLLLAATAQSVTGIAEWSIAETDAAAGRSNEDFTNEDFEDYLTRASPTRASPASGIAAANARLRSLLSSSQPEEPS